MSLRVVDAATCFYSYELCSCRRRNLGTKTLSRVALHIISCPRRPPLGFCWNLFFAIQTLCVLSFTASISECSLRSEWRYAPLCRNDFVRVVRQRGEAIFVVRIDTVRVVSRRTGLVVKKISKKWKKHTRKFQILVHVSDHHVKRFSCIPENWR